MIKQVKDIITRYGNDDCAPGEKQFIDAWYEELVNTGELHWEDGEKEALQAATETSLLQKIADDEMLSLSEREPVPFIRRGGWWAAAVLILTAGGYFLLNRSPRTASVTKNTAALKNDVAPGGNKAVLTLTNGATIVLNDAVNGTVAQQGNTKVIKPDNGQLIYTQGDDQPFTIDHSTLTWNTLATPRSGQFRLVLPDGTRVWLNAASSIHYPTAFTGNERKVQLTGEAYFEVAHNSKKPFIVDILPSTIGRQRLAGGAAGGNGGGRVEVLGTRFNVNAYTDEAAIKTTLLNGKVKVVSGEWSMVNGESVLSAVKGSAILKPGEQAAFSSTRVGAGGRQGAITVRKVDVDNVLAWKNGLFHFDNTDIKTVMRQLARWYDVEVVYKGRTLKDDPLFVEMSRNTNLSDVLKVLELSGSAKFSIEGRTIIVK